MEFAEGKLKVLSDNKKKFAERHVFLCDGMIIICKQQLKRNSSVPSSQCEYRLRDSHLIRCVEVNDACGSYNGSNLSSGNCDDHGYLFELCQKEQANKDQPLVVFKADSLDERNVWMAALVMLKTKTMLERKLDAILAEEKGRHPLRFPPSHVYRFAEPNSKENIVFASDKAGGVPLIKVNCSHANQ